MRWVVLVGLMLLPSTGRAEDACPQRFGASDILAQIDQAEGRLKEVDSAGFFWAVEQAESQLACVGEPLPVSVVARIHTAMGIRAFLQRRPEDADESFAASRATLDGVFPTALFAPSHPAYKAYLAAEIPATTNKVRAPRLGKLWIDGAPGLKRPDARAALLQQVDGGRALTSAYLLSSDPGLVYLQPNGTAQPAPEAMSKASTKPSTVERAPRERGGLKAAAPALFASAGVAAVSALATGLIAMDASSRLEQGPAPADEPGLQRRAEGYGAAAMASGITAGVLGVGGVVTVIF